jgi:hypothetical protein
VNEYQYILTYDGTPTTLDINPDGWNEIGISFERSTTYSGILRFFSFPLRFARKSGGGGDVILEAYDTEGISAEVTIEQKKRNPQTNAYDSNFIGILDFKENSFTIERDVVEINVIDSSKQQKFVSRDEINYDLNSLKSTDDVTIGAFSGQPVYIDFFPIDIYLQCVSDGEIDSGSEFIDTYSSTPTISNHFETYYLGELSINEVGDSISIEDDPATWTIYTNETDNNVIIRFNNLNIDYHVVYQLGTLNDGDNRLRFTEITAIQIYDELDNLILNNLFYGKQPFIAYDDITSPYPGGSNSYNLNFDYGDFANPEEVVEPGWTVKFQSYFTFTGESYNGQATINLTHTVNNFDFTIINIGEPETSVKGFLPHEAFTRLVQLMTSETDTDKLFYSEFFGRTYSEFETYSINGEGALDFITSGFNLRGYPNRALNVSFRELYKIFDGIYNLGVGFDYTNDRFYIEQKQEFYKSNYFMFELSSVKDLKIKPLGDEYYSQIFSGYKNKVEYEELQGANEYNVPTEHSISLPVKNKLDIQGGYYTDSIGMELARRKQYKNYVSEDTRYDNLIFIVKTDGSAVIQNGTGVTGFEGIDLYYNINFTPRENLIRWANILKIPLWKSTILVKFVKSQKDIDITYTNQNNDVVNEFDDIEASELLDTRLFNPEVYSFEAPLTSIMVTTLLSDPHGYVEFTFDNVTYQGFVKKIESNDYGENATWELLGRDVPVGDNFIFEDDNNFILESDNNLIFEE